MSAIQEDVLMSEQKGREEEAMQRIENGEDPSGGESDNDHGEGDDAESYADDDEEDGE